MQITVRLVIENNVRIGGTELFLVEESSTCKLHGLTRETKIF